MSCWKPSLFYNDFDKTWAKIFTDLQMSWKYPLHDGGALSAVKTGQFDQYFPCELNKIIASYLLNETYFIVDFPYYGHFFVISSTIADDLGTDLSLKKEGEFVSLDESCEYEEDENGGYKIGTIFQRECIAEMYNCYPCEANGIYECSCKREIHQCDDDCSCYDPRGCVIMNCKRCKNVIFFTHEGKWGCLSCGEHKAYGGEELCIDFEEFQKRFTKNKT